MTMGLKGLGKSRIGGNSKGRFLMGRVPRMSCINSLLIVCIKVLKGLWGISNNKQLNICLDPQMTCFDEVNEGGGEAKSCWTVGYGFIGPCPWSEGRWFCSQEDGMMHYVSPRHPVWKVLQRCGSQCKGHKGSGWSFRLIQGAFGKYNAPPPLCTGDIYRQQNTCKSQWSAPVKGHLISYLLPLEDLPYLHHLSSPGVEGAWILPKRWEVISLDMCFPFQCKEIRFLPGWSSDRWDRPSTQCIWVIAKSDVYNYVILSKDDYGFLVHPLKK